MKQFFPLTITHLPSMLLTASLLMTPACTQPLAQVSMPVTLPLAFSQTGEQAVSDKWWQALNDEQLNGLIDQALAGNLDLQIAWDRLALAQAQSRKSGAPLLPSVDLTSGLSTQTQRSSGKRTADNSFSVGVGASYELDLWGKLRSARDASVYAQQATALDVHTAAITLSASVAHTWYQLIEQLGQIQLLDEQIKLNAKIQEVVELRFKRGQAAASDLLRQKALVESRQGDRILADGQAAVYRHQLAVLLGQLPNSLTIQPPTQLVTLSPLPATGLPLDVIQRRPDVQSAFASILETDRNLAEAIADQYPTLSLSVNVGTSAQEIRDLFDNWLANIAANLVAPLFDGGERKAEVDRQKAMVSEALHTYHQAILDAINDVEDALVQEAHQRDYIASLSKQLELNSEAVSRVRDQYTKGGTDYLNVLDALLDLQSTERQLLSARQSLIAYRINLYRGLSGSWQMTQPPVSQTQQTDNPKTPS